jgi:hypothetical protein
MKCPGLNCPNMLPIHGRRRYCHGCRNSMAYHAKKTPRQILDTSRKYAKWQFRVEHLAERKMDIQEAVSQKRRDVKVRKQSLFGKRSLTNGRGIRVQ